MLYALRTISEICMMALEYFHQRNCCFSGKGSAAFPRLHRYGISTSASRWSTYQCTLGTLPGHFRLNAFFFTVAPNPLLSMAVLQCLKQLFQAGWLFLTLSGCRTFSGTNFFLFWPSPACRQFLGQGSNSRHSSNLSCYSDNAGSLTG